MRTRRTSTITVPNVLFWASRNCCNCTVWVGLSVCACRPLPQAPKKVNANICARLFPVFQTLFSPSQGLLDGWRWCGCGIDSQQQQNAIGTACRLLCLALPCLLKKFDYPLPHQPPNQSNTRDSSVSPLSGRERGIGVGVERKERGKGCLFLFVSHGIISRSNDGDGLSCFL